jgi:putative nucleotidyltransferase with HDIG domain
MHPNRQMPEARPAVGALIPNYGNGSATISSLELMRLDPDALTGRLVDLFRSPGYQPPVLPAAASQIMKLSTDPLVECKALVEVLGTDPLLMGRVTTTARSPVYAGGHSGVRTLQEAVRRLGIRGLRNIVIEAAMSLRVFRTPAYTECMETVRRHSLVVAHLSHLVARAVRVDPNEAFLAGLMHDVGLAGGLLVLADGKRKEDAPALGRYWPSVDRAHPIGGAAMVRLWGLPEELVASTLAHHEPHGLNGFDPLSACVCVAEHMASLLGARVQYDFTIGAPPPRTPVDTTPPAQLIAARNGLKLTPPRLDALLESARELYPLIG